MLLSSASKISQVCLTNVSQQRGMATLKDISIRLKSVKNIQKITKSMKMVAAAKYAKAERELKGARAYGEGAQTFYDNINETAEEGVQKEAGKKRLLVLCTSDRGLCGAVHTNIAKEAKNILRNKPADTEYKLVIIGDKAKATMGRTYADDFSPLTKSDVLPPRSRMLRSLPRPSSTLATSSKMERSCTTVSRLLCLTKRRRCPFFRSRLSSLRTS
ncbi:hypothetical protein L596_005728 [Steinernema carpocapsae]|uniref:ATP synthase subunit gamma n=1 Tax=Steinernema carpocapsae TaxID=34508 RepID=A0A4U8V5G0_STECR|nr:hypothetical protein L596_005728 [Steinernema carpocapsae]